MKSSQQKIDGKSSRTISYIVIMCYAFHFAVMCVLSLTLWSCIAAQPH
jgi:hypothetical protein